VKYFNDDGGLIIKSWCLAPEDGALDQARNLAKLPFAYRQICLMPDTHQGYGMPIGGVLATKGAVIPNAVGVDIGCGMCAVRTSLDGIDTDTLKTIMGKIREAIPVGFNHHKEPQDNAFVLPGTFGPIIAQEEGKIDYQIGTLGGGNHFIEIQRCADDGRIWVMIHSGSRNLGKKVADYYNKIARDLNARWYSTVSKTWDLAFLPMDTSEYKAYMNDMQICVDFALANRNLIIERIKDIFREVTGCVFEETINIAHNYARWENHFGEPENGRTNLTAGEHDQ